MGKSLISGNEEIFRLIPQRPPFMLVDTIFTHSENEIVSGFKIPADHILVDTQGYLTESGIIENLAQTIALYQGYHYYMRNLPAPVGYIGAIKNIEIFQLPKAGEELETSVHILQEVLDVTMVTGEVRSGGVVIATGEMRTVIAKNIE